MFIDTHCHLSYGDLYKNLDSALQNARDASVRKIISMGNNLEDANLVKTISNNNEAVYYAVGLHPEDCVENSMEDSLSEVESLQSFIADSKCVAIGEIGLDNRWLEYLAKEKYLSVSDWKEKANDVQMSVFSKLLDWALEVDYPVVVHCREAEKEMFDLLESFTLNGGRGVLHSFTGNLDFLQHFLKKGMYVSFNGIITFKNGQNVRDLLSSSPVEQILLETDAPFLAPEPYRGQLCEPVHVVEVYKKTAEIKDLEVSVLENIVEENVRKLFTI